MCRPILVACLLSITMPLAGGECPAARCQFGVCTECGRFCRVTAEPGTEEVPCYEVECKEVCIPAVRFPWQSCGTRRCGRVRLVARLKESSREIPACEYEWKPVCPACRPTAPASTP